MQELRLVLILVGALAIVALLFHGLWTNKRETSLKFGTKIDIPLDSEINEEELALLKKAYGESQKEEEIDVHQERKEPSFGNYEPSLDSDALISDSDPIISVDPAIAVEIKQETKVFDKQEDNSVDPEDEESPLFVDDRLFPKEENEAIEQDVLPGHNVNNESIQINNGIDQEDESLPFENEYSPNLIDNNEKVALSSESITSSKSKEESVEEDVIIVNVHGMGKDRFNGERLFNALEQNGLIFGDMGIYHRHSDLAGSGEIIFSVANIISPGHFQIPEGEAFSTPGISFFLPLPCYGEAEYNFKLMLQTAQLISSELGGNVLDENRDMLTPNKIDEYKRRVKCFA